MRDLVLREGLKTMAGDAALRLRELLAEGKEIPYEVREASSGSLAEYVPQTSRFIRDHSAELVAIDSFGSTCAALESAALAGTYLEEMGVPEPGDARRRGELAGVVFLCRLWQGSTDFTLDDQRLAATMEELLALGEASEGEVEIAVPLRGFQMDSERLELAGATLVRADAVDVPAEARGTEGMGGAGWEPTFLAVARLRSSDDGEGPDLGSRAVAIFNRVVTTLQLFKAGGVALGAHAWIRSGGDRWRRIATGSGKPRPGGYRLADTELADLAGFARALAQEHTPFARIDHGGGFPAVLGRALSRFEAGLERPVTLEALNDYLLTLRFLLEGGGPASLGMPMRVAALCAEPDRRTEVKSTVENALALERELWSGEPTTGSERRPPAEIAAEVEDLARAIIGDAACGHLGTDLRATADEILLGDGLQVGEGAPDARGETAEWNPEVPIEEAEFDMETLEEELESAMGEQPADDEEAVDPAIGEDPVGPGVGAEEPAGPVFVRAQNLIHDLAPAEPEPQAGPAGRGRDADEPVEPDFYWEDLDEADDEPQPAGAEIRVLRPRPERNPVSDLIEDSNEHQQKVESRVSFLFPPPETTEWKIREVGYDRTRRAQVDDSATHAS